MVLLNSAIVPWKEMGGINLYSHISEFYSTIIKLTDTDVLFGKTLVRYEIKDEVYLWFNLFNGKLFKITALKNYTGKLFNEIQIGMSMEEVLKIEPSFEYDEFEEVYGSPKGIYIETEPIDNTVLWISIYIKEIDNEDFEKGNW
ncbi:hypothetical protein JJQ72_14580 [Paenibacillus sp. F411]|uniref:Uncharacterized protein n=2 Tax=Paenibacillus algicola TaxID=2565926 RepID=A0A4P8XGK7_9BACL|nr:hypothetical protein [Paenibacillus sp. F411]MBO2945201.1 hypothetical protein [Paenibacillus sp. F411]QCT01596.1 hypothetical protein E6C60_0875 [Paenibacillus algicola]